MSDDELTTSPAEDATNNTEQNETAVPDKPEVAQETEPEETLDAQEATAPAEDGSETATDDDLEPEDESEAATGDAPETEVESTPATDNTPGSED